MAPPLLLQRESKLLILFFTFLFHGHFLRAQVPIPTAASPQIFCEGATVSDLQATGTSPLNLAWYATANSGTPLPGNTPLQYAQKYYVAEHRSAYMNHVATLGGGLTNGRSDVVADADNNLYITDGNVIKKYDAANGTISVFSGTGSNGSQDGKADQASFAQPGGLAIDGSGNLYVADTGNGLIRMVDKEGTVTTLAGAGGTGDLDGPAATALFNWPMAITCDPDGSLYVADFNNHKIRVIKGGMVGTLAGNGTQGLVDGTGTSARFYFPIDITIDSDGQLYVADHMNARIRRIGVGGNVVTIFNTSSMGFNPVGIAARAGSVYISSDNHRIFKISYNSGSGFYEGELTAGTLEGDIDGIYSVARIRNPQGITVGADGGIYFAELSNKLKKVYNQLATEFSGRREVEVILSVLSVNISLSPDQTATANVVGLSDPYTFSWSPSGATTQVVQGLPPGQHTVTVTDALGCTAAASVTLAEPIAPLAVSFTYLRNVSCTGSPNGGAIAAATGGTEPYTYLWSNDTTTAHNMSLRAGTYSVTVTDATGETATAEVTITEPEHRPTLSITGQTGISCYGLSDGGLDLLVEYGEAPYTFEFRNYALSYEPAEWENIPLTGSSTARATGLPAGEYVLRVRDAGGCPGVIHNVVVSSPLQLTVNITGKTEASPPGAANGSATAQGAGGTAPYTYLWQNGAVTAAVTGLASGSYTVTVTDANACTANSEVLIDDIPLQPLSVSIIHSTPVSCFGGSDGSATALAAGGAAPYTYEWSNGPGTPAVSGLSAGTYTVTVTDAQGGTTATQINLTEPHALALNVASVTGVSCFEGEDGRIDYAISGGTAPYSSVLLTLSAVSSLTWTGNSTFYVSGLHSREVRVRITDAGGCSVTDTTFVPQPLALTADISSLTPASCETCSDGSATAFATGGTAPYAFEWSHATPGASATGLSIGQHTVTVTDANGCRTTALAAITVQGTPLTVAISDSTGVSCFGLSDGIAVALASGGTAPYSYEWSDGTATAGIAGLSAGTYTVIVTDADNHTAEVSVTIDQPEAVTLTLLSQENVKCYGGSDGSAFFRASGGAGAPYTYNWVYSVLSGDILPENDTLVKAINLSAQALVLRVVDAQGCSAPANFLITQPAEVLTITLSDHVHVSAPGANDGRVTATGSGGVPPYSYLWSTGATTATVTGLAAGNFTVTLTDHNGCVTDTAVSISAPGVPLLVSITGSTNISCFGGTNGSATALAAGGTAPYSYEWSNGATTATATGLSAGTYTVTVTDADGATAEVPVTLTPPNELRVNVASASHPTCYGRSDGTIDYRVRGGVAPYSFHFDQSSVNFTITGDSTIQATALTARMYTLWVTDANGCSAGRFSGLTQPAELTLSLISQSNATAPAAADGAATVEAEGGTGPYSYLWPNGETTAAVTHLAPGQYIVAVIDENGCGATTVVSISAPGGPALEASITDSTNVSCSGPANGSATAAASGGAAPYSYAWSNGAATATATGLSPGTYTVTVTDTNGDTATAQVTITGASSADFGYVSHSHPQSCGNDDGSISFHIAGLAAGDYTLTYEHNGDEKQVIINVISGTFTLGDLPAGLYTDFRITDQNCIHFLEGAVTAFTLNNPPVSGSFITPGGPTELCEDDTVSLTASAGASYLWSTGATARTITVSAGGTYKVTVTSAQGCKSEAEITVTQKICNLPPVAVCKPLVVLVANADCYAVLTTDDLNGGSFDPNGDWTRHTLLHTDGIFRPGEYTVTYEVMDPKGAFSTCQSQVRVLDHTPPVARARGLRLELNATGQASISVADVNDGSYDNCGPVTISLNRTTFDCSDLGHLQVRLTVTDASGNVSEALSDISIVDNTPPLIQATDFTLALDQNGRAVINTENMLSGISDNCGIWSVNVSQNEFTCEHIGKNEVTITVEDVQGNRSTATVTVTVLDNTPPVVKARELTLYLDAEGKATLSTDQADEGSYDNCGISALSIDRDTFDCNDLGEQTLTLSATDAAGNTSEAAFTLTVRDTLVPVVLARNITLYLNSAGSALLTPQNIDEGSSDNCGISTHSLQYTAFDCGNIGTQPVQYTVTDGSGNSTTVVIQVTVSDTTAPEALTQNVMLQLDFNAAATLSAGEVDSGSTDNCGIAEMSLSQTAFSCADLGRRLLTLTVRDVNGNSGTARAVAEVTDPNGVCPCSYGVLAFEGIIMRSNTVSAGGVGVINAAKKAKLRNTVINLDGTFVKAPQSRFDNESEASTYIRGTAPKPEAFRNNPNKDKNKEKAAKGEALTLAAGRYGKVKAGKDATLTFSGGEVYLRSLKVKKNAALVFTAPTTLLVRKSVKLGLLTALNTGGEQARVYAGGNITVGNASEIRGMLHTRGRLKTRRGGDITSLEGLFVAHKIRGGRNTHWAGGGVLCTGNNEPEPTVATGKERRQAQQGFDRLSLTDSTETGVRVNLWPNPVVSDLLKVAVESDTPDGELLLVDMQGNVLIKKAYTGRQSTHEIDMRRALPGTYVLRVSSGGEVKTLRVIKEGK